MSYCREHTNSFCIYFGSEPKYLNRQLNIPIPPYIFTQMYLIPNKTQRHIYNHYKFLGAQLFLGLIVYISVSKLKTLLSAALDSAFINSSLKLISRSAKPCCVYFLERIDFIDWEATKSSTLVSSST